MAPPRAHIQPFAGRIGGNQGLVLDRNDPQSAEVLEKVPDAAPLMTAREGLGLKGFLNTDYWRFGLLEGIGERCIVFRMKRELTHARYYAECFHNNMAGYTTKFSPSRPNWTCWCFRNDQFSRSSFRRPRQLAVSDSIHFLILECQR